MKKVLALLLSLVMVLSMAACGGEKTTPDAPKPGEGQGTEDNAPASTEGYQDPYADLDGDYDLISEAIYNDQLGEFLRLYEAALEETTDLDLRYAMMAIAEAKLLESSVMVPTNTRGGNYSIARVVPRSAPTVMWGSDMERNHRSLVTTELLKTADRIALKTMWAELKGTGTWEESAKAYLTEHGYTLKDSLTMGYATDVKNWDIQGTTRENDIIPLVQCVDGLMEYDSENVLQPAMAESYEISDDGLTYTFHLRRGVQWVDSQGREIAEVRADDFVAGMQHVLDTMSGLEFLLDGRIAGASDYITGETDDFAAVGVKAPDDYTVVYTLEEPTPYFLTMLGYGSFSPLCREYYVAQGGKFGADFDAAAESYKYGKSPDTICYNGPFLVTNYTPENTIVMKANPSYWDPASNNIQSLTYLFNDGKDPLKAYNDCKSGVLDGAGLTASAAQAAKTDGLFEEYVDVANTNGTSFCGSYNMNRAAFENFNDGAAASEKDEEARIRTIAALRNVHFRRAITFSIDRASRQAQMVGEDLKLAAIRNSWTPGTFVSLANETTVDINGEATTFPAGTFYGEIMQAQIDADGDVMQVWNPEADGGIGSSDGFDGLYNPEAAKAELELAIAELAQVGVEISPDKPIYLDNPYAIGVEWMKNQANALKQSVETVLGGNVVVSLVNCDSQDEVSYTGFLVDTGDECNFDFSDGFGWGPDYGDPSTYLDCYMPFYTGSMVRGMGIF